MPPPSRPPVALWSSSLVWALSAGAKLSSRDGRTLKLRSRHEAQRRCRSSSRRCSSSASSSPSGVIGRKSGSLAGVPERELAEGRSEGQGEAEGVRSKVRRVPEVEVEKVEDARGRGVGGTETEDDRRNSEFVAAGSG